MRERETDLVALVGFFAAILGRCFCVNVGVGVGVLFHLCVVIAWQDNFRLGRRTDWWKKVIVCCLHRLAEGNAVQKASERGVHVIVRVGELTHLVQRLTRTRGKSEQKVEYILSERVEYKSCAAQREGVLTG